MRINNEFHRVALLLIVGQGCSPVGRGRNVSVHWPPLTIGYWPPQKLRFKNVRFKRDPYRGNPSKQRKKDPKFHTLISVSRKNSKPRCFSRYIYINNSAHESNPTPGTRCCLQMSSQLVCFLFYTCLGLVCFYLFT